MSDLTEAMVEWPGKYEAEVVRVNPQPTPSKQRVLIEMRGCWTDKGDGVADHNNEISTNDDKGRIASIDSVLCVTMPVQDNKP